MKTIYVVGGAIVRGNEVLAALRGPQMSHPDVWEFPGGKVEEGESPQRSLGREIEEELGVRVEVGEFVARGESVVDARRIVLDVYLCTIIEGTPVATEHAELRWVSRSNLGELAWAEADVPAVLCLMRGTAGTAGTPSVGNAVNQETGNGPAAPADRKLDE